MGCSYSVGPVIVLGCDLSEGQCQEFLARLGLLALITSGESQPLSALFDLNGRAQIFRRNCQGKKNNSVIHVLCSWGSKWVLELKEQLKMFVKCSAMSRLFF